MELNPEEQIPGASKPELSGLLAVTADELRVICDATVRLTEIRQRGCAHLCVENVAPEIMRKLLIELQIHKQGFIRAQASWPWQLDSTANAELTGTLPQSSKG